jgi:hypothetical protein
VAATVSENFGTLLPYAPLLGERDLAAALRFGVASCWRNGSRTVSYGTVTATCAPST